MSIIQCILSRDLCLCLKYIISQLKVVTKFILLYKKSIKDNKQYQGLSCMGV